VIKWLAEGVGQAPLGTIVTWRTPAGPNFGTVIGTEGDLLVVVTAVDKALLLGPTEKLYFDAMLSSRVTQGIPGLPRLRIDVHKVPAKVAFRRGKLKGMQLKPYVRIVKMLHGPVKLGKSTKSKAVKALEGVFA